MFNAQYLTEAAQLEQKWMSKDVLSEDMIPDENLRRQTAVLIENQVLANNLYLGPLNENDATDSSDVAVFRRITVPLVRRLYPNLIAQKLVGVQPLLGPTGLVYYLRFRHGLTKGETKGSDVYNDTYGGVDYDKTSMQQKNDGTAVLDIWYTSSFVRGEAQTGGSANTSHAFTANFSPVRVDSIEANSLDKANNPAVTVGTKYTVFGKITLASSAVGYFALTSADTSAVTLVDSTGAPLAGQTVAQSINASTGVLTLTFTVTSVANPVLTINYAYRTECNASLPSVTMTVEFEEIVAETRRMKAAWSWEVQQDLRAQHNLDAETELVNLMAQEMNMEIDREILYRLRVGAGTKTAWDFQTALGDNVKEKYESLYVKLVETSNIVFLKTLRGAANFIVCHPTIATILETATAGFAPAPGNDFEMGIGVQYVGTIRNKFKLYKDPLFPPDQILMGYKGDNTYETGFMYCPYIPAQLTPTVLDPDSLCPRKGIMSRHGMKMLREGGKYYATIAIQGYQV